MILNAGYQNRTGTGSSGSGKSKIIKPIMALLLFFTIQVSAKGKPEGDSVVNTDIPTLNVFYGIAGHKIIPAYDTKLQPPPVQITGRVVNQKGNPLQGVSVLVVGSTNGTATNSDGRFTITVTDPQNTELEISSIGFQTKVISVGKETDFNIVLEEDITGLNDVTVVGYSTQRKKDITGSVAVVDMKALNSVPTGSASQALQGQAPGVTVISSGVPGGQSNIFIRGVTSFGNTQPLVLVDGVQSSLDDLNMNDIESIQVLKDAGAAAIYGVRGSNGVVVVTTKKGKSGVPTVSLDSYYGMQFPKKGNVFDLMNSTDYAQLYKKVDPGTILFANGLPDYTYAGPGSAGVAMEGDPAIDPSKYNFDAANPENDYLIQKVNKSGTDWFHEVFKRAPMQDHSLSVAGGTDNSKYLLSLGYFDQQGTLIETFLKRYSVRVNTQFNPTKNIRIGENAYLFYRQSPGFDNMSEGNAVSMSYLMSPIIPVYDIMGNFGGTWIGPELGANPTNPVANQMRTANNKSNTWDMVGNVYAEVDFLKHFTGRTSFGGTIDNQYYYSFDFNQYNEKQGHNGQNGFNENALYNSSYTWTNTLNYSNAFDKHQVKILLGSEAIKNYGRGVGGGSKNFFLTDPSYLILNNGSSNITNYSRVYSNALFSLFSRLDYSYDDKYLLGATLRRDGSSVFGSDKRYGWFPSFSVGWRVSNESFMRNVGFINDLKLRASYGILGSQTNVLASNAFSLYSTGFGTTNYDINGTSNSVQTGFAQSSIGNANTGWEEDVITNIGLDLTIINNKLNLNFEWYKKAINGLLFPLPLPATTGGATSPIVNIGNIENKGLDASAIYRDNISNDFSYSIGLNVTTYKNLVDKIPDPGYFDVAGSRIGNLVRNQVGHPVGSFFGYQVIGLFASDEDVSKSPDQQDAAPGRFKYLDTNRDGSITPDDRVFFGNPNPSFTYGLNLSMNYKSFDLSGVFYGSQGNDVMNFNRYYTHFFGTGEGKGRSNVLKNAWTPQNLNATVPIAEINSSFSTNSVINSYYLEDGSFFKLRSLILGYRINPDVLKRTGINSCRIYFQAANLFTITRYSGLDPELGGSLSGSQASASFGIDYGNYPNNQRTMILGINLKF